MTMDHKGGEGKTTIGVDLAAALTPSGRRRRLADIPHKRASEIIWTDVPAQNGIGPYRSATVITACGREKPTTLVTQNDDRVRCQGCKAAMTALALGEMVID